LRTKTVVLFLNKQRVLQYRQASRLHAAAFPQKRTASGVEAVPQKCRRVQLMEKPRASAAAHPHLPRASVAAHPPKSVMSTSSVAAPPRACPARDSFEDFWPDPRAPMSRPDPGAPMFQKGANAKCKA